MESGTYEDIVYHPKNTMKKKKGYYSISAVAEMFSIHQQTIRLYEREGLIAPKRSEGNTRLFTEEDIDRLEEIIFLTHKIGVNLAGVEMILKQKKKIDKLQKEINTLFKHMQSELEKDEQTSKEQLANASRRLSKTQEHRATTSAPSSQKLLSHQPSEDHEHD